MLDPTAIAIADSRIRPGSSSRAASQPRVNAVDAAAVEPQSLHQSVSVRRRRQDRLDRRAEYVRRILLAVAGSAELMQQAKAAFETGDEPTGQLFLAAGIEGLQKMMWEFDGKYRG